MFDTSPGEILDYHRRLLADRERLRAYDRAIQSSIRPGDTVLDLGCGTGILGLLACRAGARRVVAVDSGPVIELARTLAAANGFAERIVFVRTGSARLRLEEPVDAILTETIGNLGLDEGLVASIADARRRLLKPGGTVIPRRIESHWAPVELPAARKAIDAWSQIPLGLDFSVAAAQAANQPQWLELPLEAILAEPARLIEVALLEAEDAPCSGEAVVTVTRSGTCHGVGGWFRAHLTETVQLSNAPPLVTRSWNHGLLPLADPIPVRAGDRLRLTVRTDALGSLWQWSVTQLETSAGPRPAARPQSTLAGRFLSAQELRKNAADYRPRLGREGEVRRFALERMNGATELAEIARQLSEAFPDQFASSRDALELVRELARRYA